MAQVAGAHLSYQAAKLGERNPLLLILVATAATPAPTTAAVSTAATVAAPTAAIPPVSPSAESALEATTVRHVTGVCSDINNASLVSMTSAKRAATHQAGVRRQVGRACHACAPARCSAFEKPRGRANCKRRQGASQTLAIFARGFDGHKSKRCSVSINSTPLSSSKCEPVAHADTARG